MRTMVVGFAAVAFCRLLGVWSQRRERNEEGPTSRQEILELLAHGCRQAAARLMV